MNNENISNTSFYIEYCIKLYRENIISSSIIDRINYLKYLATFMANNVSYYFSSDFLEYELNKISEEISVTLDTTYNQASTLHIVTQAYKTGGHTKLLECWIDNLGYKETNSLLVINGETEMPDTLMNVIKKKGKIYQLRHQDYLEKAKKLAHIASKYEKIVLHIHPDEITTNLAFGNTKFNRFIIFMNHADHMFSCGYSLANITLQLSQEGLEFSEKYRGSKNNHILNIPISGKAFFLSKELARKEINLDNNKIVVLSIASEYKYGKEKELHKFLDFAKKLVHCKNNIEFLFIGPSVKSKEWLEVNVSTNGKIKPLGIVSREKLEFYIKSCDLYIESFPFSSYTAFLDVAFHRVNMLTLKTKTFTLDVIKNSNSQCHNIEELLDKSKFIIENKGNYNYVVSTKNHEREKWISQYNKILSLTLALKNNESKRIETKKAPSEYTEFISRIIGSNIPLGRHYKKMPFLTKVSLLKGMFKFHLLNENRFKAIVKTIIKL